MNVIEIKLPKTIHLSSFEIKMNLASKLFEEGKLSSGQAADLVGITKRSFIEIVGKYNVSIFGYNEIELDSDLENA